MYDAIYPLVIVEVPVIPKLEVEVQADDDATGYRDRKPEDVDQREHLVAGKISEGDFYEV
jgi:hypothetical protein